MNPQKLRLGLILAAAGMLLAPVLPLSGEAAAMSLSAWPLGLALTVCAALLFVAGAWRGGAWATALGLMGVLCGAATTLALLRDPAIAGSAAAGFWAVVQPCDRAASRRAAC